MKLKHLIIATSIALLPLAAGAATFIVPAAGTGPGANGSQWQSELTLHNTSASAVTIGLKFHDANGTQQGDNVALNARSTMSIADVVKTRFGRESGTGAIEITIPDAAAKKVAITSRTFNVSASGELGQDIPAINLDDAATAGDVVVLQGPSSVTAYRFNFGVYAAADSVIRWDVVRADGSGSTPIGEQSYAAGTQLQFNRGMETLLGTTPQDNDTLHAVVTKGKVIAYGSAVNHASGDPSFVPGIRARADIRVNFVGVDRNENGTVDFFDADHDGVLDQPIDVPVATFPSGFRIVVTGLNGEPAKLEVVESNGDVLLYDTNAILWTPPGDPTLKSGVLKIRATVGNVSEILTIPANFL